MQHEIELKEVEGSLPCIPCPECGNDNIEFSTGRRQTLPDGAQRVVIKFKCYRKHNWEWVLTYWEGRTFLGARPTAASVRPAA